MRKRLVILTETSAIGGSEKFVADLIQHLDHDRFECILAGNEHPAFDGWLVERVGRPIERYSLQLHSYNQALPVRIRRTFSQRCKATPSVGTNDRNRASLWPAQERVSLLKSSVTYGQMPLNWMLLQQLFRRLRPDVLHVNNGGYPAARSCQIAPLAAKAVGVGRVITFVHAYAVEPIGYTRPELALDRTVDRNTDAWVTASFGSSERLTAVRAIAPNKVQTVHLGQPLLAEVGRSERVEAREKLGLSADTVTLFNVGMLYARKGQSYAIQALRLIHLAGLPCHLVLVGAGEDRSALERLANRLGLREHVTFLGFRTDVEELLAACDILLSASTEVELLPYAIKEAMARGLPAVATDVGGTRELVVDGVTGLLVPPSDSAAIAAAACRLITNPGERLRMGRAARARIAEKFSMRSMVGHIQQLYEGNGACHARPRDHRE